ncbi:cache domain-containing sensor histidine kinase [Paenibacillus eucommiae]|uniref:histidine kinase n=1 Tax=Paenibacillus eucommiae TaxID=1355755 RepID=A0ABS4IQN6_9BACL|nr:sensor histidine kinase [Paenibacillus eucommiae]MBP1989455.1 sensor histidine kinase YesM [Paenibacillus eucommiae]
MGNSIFKKLLSTSLIMVVSIAILIGVISYNIAAHILILETEKYLINELKQIDRSLLTIVEDVNQSAGILQNNTILNQVFTPTIKTSFQRYSDATEVEKLLKTAISNNDAILGAMILSQSQDFAAGFRTNNYTYEELLSTPIYQKKVLSLQDDQYLLVSSDELFQSSRSNQMKVAGDGTNIIFMVKKISNSEGNDVIMISFLSTASIMQKQSAGNVYAIDRTTKQTWLGTTLTTTDTTPLMNVIAAEKPEGSIREESNRFVYMKSGLMDWYLVNLISEKNIVKPLNEIRIFVVLHVSIIVVICMIAAMFASRGLTWRIRKMKQAFLKGINGPELLTGYYASNQGYRFLFFKSMKFGYKLFLFYMCIVIVPMLVLSLLLYQKTVHIVENQLEQSFRQTLLQASSSIDMLLNRHIRNAKYMITNENVQLLYTMPPLTELTEYRKQQQTITKEIMNKAIYHNGLSTITLYKMNGEVLYSSSQIHDELKAPLMERKTNMVWVDTHADEFQNQVFSLVHEIKGNILFTEGFAQTIGYLKVDIQEALLSQMFKDVRISNQGAVLISNSDGVILSANDKQTIGKKLKELPLLSLPGKMFKAETGLSYSDWRIHALLPSNELVSSKNDLITYNLFVLSIMMLVIVIICIQKSAVFLRPIHSLIRVIKKVQEGNLGVRFYERSGDEIELLGRSFNTMLDRLQSLIEQITASKIREQELETKKREAELNALQSQINPHFLYNTFESINWLVIQSENEKAVKMMTSLADLFRIGINRGQHIVSVGEEVQHAEAYITIQKIRYNEKLNVHWNIHEDANLCKTIKLVLQPIIENAIYHGIELMEGPGTIQINGFIHEGSLQLQIADNGLGMEDERLNELRERFRNWYHEPSRSIGLLNVNERIKLMFGDQYGLQITSKINEGTVVTVMLPIL